jgi:hypothetical protein
MLGAGGVDEAGELATVDDLVKSAMEEGILNVELTSLLVEGEHDGEDDAHHRRFDNRAECLVEFNAVLLGETTKHPT